MKLAPIEIVRARERDPATKTGAQERVELAKVRIEPRVNHMHKLARHAIQEVRVSRKFKLLRELADIIGEAMDGIAPCGSGCSACCHIPVMMSQAEADLIGEEQGIKVATPEQYTTKGATQYTGVVCPFLVDSKCSIYASRPFSCRVHFSMDVDDLLCQIRPGESIEVPYFNNMDYLMILIHALGEKLAPQQADIREFFPEGRGHDV